MRRSTRLIVHDAAPEDPHRPTSTPLYQTATFHQTSAVEMGTYDYTRSGNPTRTVLERRLADLEGAEHGYCFSSGLGAIEAAVQAARRVHGAGPFTVLAGVDLYGGTLRMLERVLPLQGIEVRWVDTRCADEVRGALDPSVGLVLCETPTNPLLEISDLESLSGVCRAARVPLAVDNSLLSPWLQCPLALGADLVVHSVTKHLAGHGDATGGAVLCNDTALGTELGFLQNALGGGLAPFECWLALRGLGTLGLRIERAQSSTQRIAEFLKAHSRVTGVHYPGLPEHPGSTLHRRQSRGAGSVLSFSVRDPESARRLVESTSLFSIAVSFGALESRISLPVHMSHASAPGRREGDRALGGQLVRLAIGLEDPDDLIEDLEGALQRVPVPAAPRPTTPRGVPS